MTKKTPPPQTLTDQILKMKVGDDHLFDQNPAHSVRAIISRLKADADAKIRARVYITRLEGDHAHVWRVK
jgi:hypothetical protein